MSFEQQIRHTIAQALFGNKLFHATCYNIESGCAHPARPGREVDNLLLRRRNLYLQIARNECLAVAFGARWLKCDRFARRFGVRVWQLLDLGRGVL